MMIDAINSNMAMYNTAQYDAAKEQADASAFEEVLRKAKQTDADKIAGKVAGRRVLTAEEKAEKLDKELKEACQGFEAMYMELMYKKMRDTVPEDELFGDSNADKIWQSMLDSEMMQQAAKSGGVGVADMLYKQLKPQVMASSGLEDTAGKGQ